MSAFIATGTAEQFNLANDGFWPDIDAHNLRAAQRIDASVTNPRLEVATVAAIISVNRELSTRKQQWQAAGYSTLADVPADQINSQSIYVAHYTRAIYSATSAEVAERYRSFDATNSGDKNAEQQTASVDDYRRDARWAVRDILGRRRTTVELI